MAARTFLIGDIRGYTAFTQSNGDAAAAHLAATFARLARDAVAARNGEVIEVRGDEVLAVMPSPAQATRAALELQATCAGIADHDAHLPLHVGIGIDAGEAVPVDGGFRGVALNRAARLCSRAAGGEVLVTAEVAAVLEPAADLTIQLRGAAELKGFDAPVEMYAALEAEPPEPAGDVSEAMGEREALPGRDAELAWLRGTWRQARRGRGRLVFLEGPAGIGKTRLALELRDLVGCEARCIATGAGGTAAAQARSGLREAVEATEPTFVVLDDLDAIAADVADDLDAAFAAIGRRPVLVVGVLRDAGALAAVVARADADGDGRRRLGPLGADAVRAIVALYAGDSVDAAPVEAITRASKGEPARVHDLAGEWARAEAARRLAGAAEYLSALRERRGGDLAFADNVIALGLGRLFGERARLDVDSGACPYKGLASFAAEDAALFVGRERLVGELAARTVEAGLLGVVGASGSGKSSAVAAGLLPSLRAGLLPGSERWRQASMRPGEHPVAALAEMPVATTADERLVLVVDQFEEAFTVCTDDEERAAFLDALAARAGRADLEVVVLVVRGDFYGACAAHPELAGWLADNHVLLGPMTRDELRRAIELPAQRAGLRVEAGLAEALAEEAAEAPGALPLLSTALVELWEARQDGRLRLADHARTGGIRGAVARLAERTFDTFDERERTTARAIFLRLVASGEAEGVTRRRVGVAEFDPSARDVLERLVHDRLLTRDGDSLEVAHEALLREWPRLQGWLQEDERGRELRRHLTQAAAQWRDAGREDAELYRGARLSAALDWAAGRQGELNELEREFLDAGRRAGEREADRQRRTNRRLRGALIGAVGLLALAVAAGAVALVQRSNARKSATVALSQSLGSQAVVEPRLDRAMLLAREAVSLDDSIRTRGNLVTTLVRAPQLLGTIAASENRLLNAALSPDGKTLAVADNTSTVSFVDPRTGRKVADPIKDFPGVSVTYSPDGRFIVVPVGDDKGRILGIDLLDAKSHRRVERLPVAPRIARERFLGAGIARFSSDGRTLAVGFLADAAPVPGLMEFFDVASRRSLGTAFVDRLGDFGFVRDGRQVVALGAQTVLLDARSGNVVRRFDEQAGIGAFNPVRPLVALAGFDGTVRFLDLRTGSVGKGDGAHVGQVDSLAFTPDGRTLATGGDDGKVLLWDTDHRAVRETLSGHASRIPALAVAADGRTLYSGSLDGAVFAWDLTGRRGFGQTFQASDGSVTDLTGANPNVAVSPDGRLMATGTDDGYVSVWDLRTQRRRARFRPLHGLVAAVAFGPGGRSLAVAGADDPNPDKRGRLRIYSLDPEPRPIHEIPALSVYNFVTTSSDGRTLLVSGFRAGEDFHTRGYLVSYDMESGRRLAGLLRTPGVSGFPTISSDDRTVAATTYSGELVLADLATLHEQRRMRVSEPSNVFQGALSPDGRRVATVAYDGHLQLRELPSGKVLGDVRAADGPMVSVTFSPDGRTIVTSGFNAGVRLRDAATMRTIGSALPTDAGVWLYAAVYDEGRKVVVVDERGEANVWPISLRAWTDHACAVAGRSFTRAEWREIAPDRPYERGC